MIFHASLFFLPSMITTLCNTGTVNHTITYTPSNYNIHWATWGLFTRRIESNVNWEKRLI